MMLSENATSNFPDVGLKLREKPSQADCARLERGIMAKKLNAKTISDCKGIRIAAKARGRKTSKRFR